MSLVKKKNYHKALFFDEIKLLNYNSIFSETIVFEQIVKTFSPQLDFKMYTYYFLLIDRG